MSTPVLHLLAGPNGAGKTTFVLDVLLPHLHLEFVNADQIAHDRWPDEEMTHAREASALAAQRRSELITARSSFISETVFSHPNKVSLVQHSVAAGYLVHLHVILLPVEVTIARVAQRTRHGGHDVPENKIRQRYDRLWPLVATAIAHADASTIYDNSRAATPFRCVARAEHGQILGTPNWPAWTPMPLRALRLGQL